MTQPRMNRPMARLKLDEDGLPVVDREPRLVIEGPALAELKRLLKRRRDLAEKGVDAFNPNFVACEKNICAWIHAQHDIQEWGLDDDCPF